jgi:hypothetical protein
LSTVRTKFAGSTVGAYRPCTGASDDADCGVALPELALLGLVPVLELPAACPLDDEQPPTVRATAAMPARLAPTRRRRTDRPRPPPSFRWLVAFPWPGTGMKITSSVALLRGYRPPSAKLCRAI